MKENSGILAARVTGTFGRTGKMLFLLRGLGHGFTAGLLSLYSSQMNIKQWPVQRRRRVITHLHLNCDNHADGLTDQHPVGTSLEAITLEVS